jgi:TetR/AcrR family transcriptional regulator, fatty acid biosynthesis regulator
MATRTRKPSTAAPASAPTSKKVLPQAAAKNEYGQGKRKLLDAATRLVAREGTTRLALRELAKEAGMSHNAIYRHFASVDDMVPEMILEFNQRLREGLRHARTQVPAAEAPTRTVVGWLFDFAKAHPDAFVVAMRERHGPSGPARQAIEQGMAHVLADMRHDLLAAKRLPPLPDSTLDTALRVIIQHTFELCLRYLDTPDRREALLQEAEQVFLWCLSGAAMSATSG